ncbi:glycosyltransferase family 2 protein [Sulfurimonas sp.]|uniref:glycosyltransferase family 2 protein n=1 Tax=Sulfurimonas sp. TaxID=2022749 RepID=UPI002AAF271A|nr:glycosyltransferase family 2 protein [Sulfurimonas sp.]
MNFCVVVPVYNSPYIKEVIEDILNYNYFIIIVDDGSDVKFDFKNENINLIRHSSNKGKGAAILSGAKRAKDLGFDFFVTVDADKQHIPSEIQKLIDAYKNNHIVIGNRDFSSSTVPNSSKFGRKFSNFWVKLETLCTLGDTQSGFRAYPIDILELSLNNTRFDFEIEILAKHSFRGGKFIDVEVECYYPPADERISHFNKLDDNVRLSVMHTKLIIQRYLFLRGWLWK